MKLIQALTTDKTDIIDMMNKLYRANKDDPGIYFDLGVLCPSKHVMLNVRRDSGYDKAYGVIELDENFEFEGYKYSVLFWIKPRKEETTIKIFIHQEIASFSIEAVVSLEDDEVHLIDPNLRDDALFYECYERVLQYLIEENRKDRARIKVLLHKVMGLKNSNILSFQAHDSHHYTLLVNDDDFKYKKLESTNRYAPMLIGDYIKGLI
ncbi:hypothetical protein ACS126_03335 [Sphingobacterium lactis]|uniref:hypothetical protein n=1 Tax=Sphingobacterium TaxID=28453 RepID=UPI000ECD588A|nr:hypothetical protein [Sphingobacterium hotanense]MCT1525814.1 hypothetical protein [Sphingobacterium hotanense]HAP96588.1 hypothetical protein [Chryseobacterium sp.]